MGRIKSTIFQAWERLPQGVRTILKTVAVLSGILLFFLSLATLEFVFDFLLPYRFLLIGLWLAIPATMAVFRLVRLDKDISPRLANAIKRIAFWSNIVLSGLLYMYTDVHEEAGGDLLEDPIGYLIGWVIIIALVGTPLMTGKMGEKLVKESEQNWSRAVEK